MVQLKTKAFSCLKSRLSADLSVGPVLEAVVLAQVPGSVTDRMCERSDACGWGEQTCDFVYKL